jgi:hypothetical protein
MLGWILTGENEMRGEMPSRVADSSSVLGSLGLKTVRARMRTIMNSSSSKRRITPPTMKHLLLLALGSCPRSLVSIIDAWRVWLVV